jgi:hypothetical protein
MEPSRSPNRTNHRSLVRAISAQSAAIEFGTVRRAMTRLTKVFFGTCASSERHRRGRGISSEAGKLLRGAVWIRTTERARRQAGTCARTEAVIEGARIQTTVRRGNS